MTPLGDAHGADPKVAVIVAAYNAAATIDETLASVAVQTVQPAEVIIGDDCSTDDTGARVQAWSDRLPITVVRTAVNGGPSAARRDAIASSSSPLLALLDADDVWMPDHLETLIATRRGVDPLVMADLINWAPGEALGCKWQDVRPTPPANQLRHLYTENYVNSCVLFSRDLYDQVGGFRLPLRVGEDWDLWIRMVRHGAVVIAADHPTVLYRVGPSSLSQSQHAGGDRVGVLEFATREARDPSERRGIRAGLRRVKADRSLMEAYRVAPSDPWRARLLGLRAIGGHTRVSVRGLAMAVAPRFVAAKRASVRAEARSRLNT